MRPLVLNPLFASLTSLSGVGPKLEKLYARLLDREAPRVIDLLFHLPSGAVDRRARPKLNQVQAGQLVTVAVTVEEHRPAPRNRPRAPYRIITSDDTGQTLTLTYFNAREDYLRQALARGRDRVTSPAPPNSTTTCCRWCIPTGWWTKRALPICRWSSRSIRSPKAWRPATCGAPWRAR